MRIPKLRKRRWWKWVLKLYSKHNPEVQQQNWKKGLVPSFLNELFLTLLVIGLNAMSHGWKRKTTCIWKCLFPENGLMLFGLTANVAMQPIISAKGREFCCDSIDHNIVCITWHPSPDIHLCTSIFGVPYKCSYLLWIYFFLVLFFKDDNVVKSDLAKELLVYSEINMRGKDLWKINSCMQFLFSDLLRRLFQVL